MTPVQINLIEFSDLITRYTASFVGRAWLAQQIDALLDDPDCRFVVLTGGPGVGKTAFMAHLATTHPTWPRYFIRRDSRAILRPGDASTFLLTIGGQLVTLYPHLFHPENLEVVVRQRIGGVQAGGEATAVRIEELHASPFYRLALRVEQEIQRVAGKTMALDIGRLVTEPRLLSLHDLLYLGVLDPARLLAQTDPAVRIVVLVDALDELRFSPADPDILCALRELPELPPNIRFVVSSRPEAFLGRLLARSDACELRLDIVGVDNQADLRMYAEQAVDSADLERVLIAQEQSVQVFVASLLRKAAGNFLYLTSVLHGIQDASWDPAKRDRLDRLLRVEELPDDLIALYGFFLASIVDWSERRGFGDAAWRQYLAPLLGVLAVAQEPLSEQQMIAFTGLKQVDIRDMLREVRQFVETIDTHPPTRHIYRIYHTSFAEYLVDPEQNGDYLVDAPAMHHRIADHFLHTWGGLDAGLPGLQEVGRRSLDHAYALHHLISHLEFGKRIDDIYVLAENKTWTAAKYVNTPWVDSLIQDLQRASALAEGGSSEDWARSMGYQLRRAIIERMMCGVPSRAILFLARLGHIDRARGFARRHQWRPFDLIRDVARIVALTQPSTAVDILVNDLAHLADEESLLNQCKVRMCTAAEVLRLGPDYLHEVQRLIAHVQRIAKAIPESDRITYQVTCNIPALALGGDLEMAISISGNLPPQQQARALRYLCLALPDTENHTKQRLAELAMDVLEMQELSPDVAREQVKSIITLLPLVESDRQAELLGALDSALNDLYSVGTPDDYNRMRSWVIDRVAGINLRWAKHMLLETDWQGELYNNGHNVVVEIAKADDEAALRLFKDRFAMWAGSSTTLADIIGIVACKDPHKAESLLDENIVQLRDATQEAYVALAEGYLAQGNVQEAQKIIDEHVFVRKDESMMHTRSEFQLAILKHAGEFVSVEEANDRLMEFLSHPSYYLGQEREARFALACIAAQQNRIDFLATHDFSQEAHIKAAYVIAGHSGPQAAREYLQPHRISICSNEGRKLDAHLTALESQQDPTRIDVLLKHFTDDGQPHHFCDYMTALPVALQGVVETRRIEPAEVRVIIEQVYPLLIDWQCPQEGNLPGYTLDRNRCRCHNQRDQVLAQLIGIMARIDFERAEQIVNMLPTQPIKAYALAHILYQTRGGEELVHKIIQVSEDSINDPWQRAEVYYHIAVSLPTEMSNAIRKLIEVAEPLWAMQPTHYYTDEFGRQVRVGPSQTELKICRLQAILKSVGTIHQFVNVIESLRATEDLVQLPDKLRVLDLLAGQAMGWSEEDRRALLWHCWKMSTTRELTDVQAFIACSIPLIHSVAGEKAFWRLYHYITWAYQDLPHASQEAETGFAL